MPWPFRKKTTPALPSAMGPVARQEASHSLAELTGDLTTMQARRMEKSLSAANYIAWDNVDDQGGYYGTEFEIRSTAGRVKGLYSREPWIYTAATDIARSLAAIPFKVYNPKNDQEIPNHPLSLLLKAGTPSHSNIEARWVLGLDLALGGNCYLVLEENMKSVAGIAPVECVQLVYAQDYSKVIAIEVYAFGQYGAQAKRVRFPIEQVVQVKYPNPYNAWYGMSPFAAAARPILLDRYKAEYEMAFYLRGATSAGVIETTEDISSSRMKRLLVSFEQAFTGRSNWWRTLFLPKGSKFVKSSLTMAEAQHLEGLRENRKTILAVMGIPPSQVGLVEDVNRATAEQQERSYWSKTLVPLAMFQASGWNQSYLVKTVFKGQVEVRPDFSGIEAVQGFLSAKAEKAKAMEPYFTIDEIREQVWGAEPMADGRGSLMAAEVRGPSAPISLSSPTPETKAVEIPAGFEVQELVFIKAQYALAHDCQKWAEEKGYKADTVLETDLAWRLPQADPDLYEPTSVKEIVLTEGVHAVIGERRKANPWSSIKAAATGSQNRIETKLGKDLEKAVDSHTERLVEDARKALRDKVNVRDYLKRRADERLTAYMEQAWPTYEAALERGFAAANSQVKFIVAPGVKRARFPGLSETDKQAVDVLRERTRDGQRRVLQQRTLSAFTGFDATQTEAIMQAIENGEAEGLTFEQIAAKLRETFGESYRNQARTVVRTEVLSAVSAGTAWNHKVLGEVFSEVKKQWLHQGDGAINPDAREEHAAFEELGEIPGDAKWRAEDGSELAYPRDPEGSAGQVINCRCTMVSVIPDDATSNAEAILEST